MHKIDLRKIDLNLLLLFDVLMQQGSVSKTAEQLGRTQSAVSHALGRLRDQLGDPLLVKVGGRMQPSPYAMELVQEVRPILRSIERVLSPREAFEPSTSTRCFRLAVPDLAMTMFPSLIRRIQLEAPGVVLQWETPKSSTLLDVSEGLVDLALLPDAIKQPEGVATEVIGEFQWACFMRSGHPALAKWTKKAWSAWPHIAVGTGDQVRSPVTLAAQQAALKRNIGLTVPTFGAVAALLAESNMIATLPTVVLADVIQRFGLEVRETPFKIEEMKHVITWSARLTNDPAALWIRACFIGAFKEQLRRAEQLSLDRTT
ncbi:LysR family transcriptional regulator [Serratia microhaemolytica]|uniref:LysR family transcriptional regulator n=1 Tax=Serratia microhaemolytica TaxID=2675110 RepID=UPI000FDE7213|nr:LysR family transcriptional regulator [Serratia microhaemolytica]